MKNHYLILEKKHCESYLVGEMKKYEAKSKRIEREICWSILSLEVRSNLKTKSKSVHFDLVTNSIEDLKQVGGIISVRRVRVDKIIKSSRNKYPRSVVLMAQSMFSLGIMIVNSLLKGE